MVQKNVNAIDSGLGRHEIKIDPSNILPIRSHHVRVQVPQGELARTPLLCLVPAS
jgi:hypothetical protein